MRIFTVRFQMRLNGTDGMLWVRVCRRNVGVQVFPPGWSAIACGPLLIGVFVARLHQAESLALLADVTDYETFPSRQVEVFSLN